MPEWAFSDGIIEIGPLGGTNSCLKAIASAITFKLLFSFLPLFYRDTARKFPQSVCLIKTENLPGYNTGQV